LQRGHFGERLGRPSLDAGAEHAGGICSHADTDADGCVGNRGANVLENPGVRDIGPGGDAWSSRRIRSSDRATATPFGIEDLLRGWAARASGRSLASLVQPQAKGEPSWVGPLTGSAGR
jgi:hypothetical protein